MNELILFLELWADPYTYMHTQQHLIVIMTAHLYILANIFTFPFGNSGNDRTATFFTILLTIWMERLQIMRGERLQIMRGERMNSDLNRRWCDSYVRSIDPPGNQGTWEIFRFNENDYKGDTQINQ